MSEYSTLVSLLDSQKENLSNLKGTLNGLDASSLSTNNIDNLLQRKLVSDAIVSKQEEILDTKIKIKILQALCGYGSDEKEESYPVSFIISIVLYVLFIVLIVLLVNKFTDK